MKILTSLLLLSFFIGIISCGKKNPDEDNPVTSTVEVPAPKKVSLIYPEHNTECNEGTNITELNTDVNFKWILAEDTDSYEIKLRNLITEQELTQTTKTDNITVTLLRATPYAWHIISKADGTSITATSDIYRFYNAGESLENHIPFPASILSPVLATTIDSGSTYFSWEGADVDNDIVGYKLYLDTVNPPVIKNTETTKTNTTITTFSNTVYYWQIVSIDNNGNKSNSTIASFRTN